MARGARRLSGREVKEGLDKPIQDLPAHAESGAGPDSASRNQSLARLFRGPALYGRRNLRINQRFLKVAVLFAFAFQAHATPLAPSAMPAPGSEAADTAIEAPKLAPAPDSGGPATRGRALEWIQVTATRRPESRLAVPVATTVLTAEALRASGAPTVMEALRGEAGVFVQQTTPGQSIVIVRGLKGSEVLHLVDGFRLNNAIFRNAPNQYMALVDSQMLDALEVVRGPMSTLYGGDAMGGVVQLLSRTPRFDGADPKAEGGLRAIWSSADRGLLSRVEGAAGHETLAISGGLTYQDVGELRVGNGERLPFTAFTARGGNVKLIAAPAEGHELLLQAQYFEQPDTPRHDELVPGFGQTNPGSAEFRFAPQVRRFTQARWRASALGFLDGLDVQVGRQVIRDDRTTRDFGTVNRDTERNTVTTDGWSIKADRQWRENHYLTFGLEGYRDEVRSSRFRTNLTSGAVSARPSRFPDGSTMRQFGAYATWDSQVTPAVDLLYGLRWSRVETVLPPTPQSGVGVRIENDDLSGNVGVNYALTEDFRLVANLGRGFRAPNVFDLGVFGDRPGNRFQIPNPNLEPERVTSVDAGIKFGGAVWSGEAIAFRSRYRDKITTVLTGERTPGGRLVVQSRNATEQTLTGLEARLEWTPDEAWRAFGSLTWTRGDETVDGNRDPADRIPPVQGRIGAEWRASGWLSVEGFAFFATRQDRLSPRDRIDPRINPNGTGGYATLNARIAWAARPGLDLALRLENLGDKRYRDHGSGFDDPGRNLIATIDWRF
jgi:outer membrane receptor protein involved in Fe transport